MRINLNDINAANTALQRASTVWFLSVVFGLWVFLTYLVVKLGGSQFWAQHPLGAGAAAERWGNFSIALHLLIAALILGAGPLQLVPKIRQRVPAFHRWLGRGYVVAVIVAMLSGLYMMFARDIGSAYLKAGFVIQAALVIWFSAVALRYAMRRDIYHHRRWVLRFFIVANIAFFFRVLLMFWILLTGGIGIDFNTGKGWFLDFMAFGQYLPLVLLEMYFAVQEHGSAPRRFAMAGLLCVCAVVIVVGVVMLSFGMWFPGLAGE